MATIMIDGFDKYGEAGVTLPPSGPALNQGGWSSTSGVQDFASIVPSLNGQGGAAVSMEYEAISKTLPTNYARLIGGFRLTTTLAGNVGMRFVDNNTAQCAIVVAPTSGFIQMFAGANDLPTLLQQSSASIAANVEHYIEFDITFGTAGGWTVWLDGVQVLAGTGNTIVSANSYANVVQFGTFYAGGQPVNGTIIVDDFYLFDSTTALNNAVLLSNPVVLTDVAIADEQTQFSNSGNVFGNTSSTNQSAMTDAYANSLYLSPASPDVACTINSVALQLNGQSGASSTANLEGVIYSDSGGVPGTLLSGGAKVTGFTQAELLSLSLTTPVTLTAGTKYWLGFITDTTIWPQVGPSSAAAAVTANNTFSSGPPSTAPVVSSSSYSAMIYGVCAGAVTNWESVALLPPLGSTESAVGSTVAGTTDYYKFPALATNIQAVYTIVVSGYCEITQSGSHTLGLLAKSGTAVGTGKYANFTPTVSYAWYDNPFDTDPNTGAAWTAAGASNAYYGMSVAS